MSDHNYPNGHKHHHDNDFRDITITDTVNHPTKYIDVTFHSAVGNSLVLNLTKAELTKLVSVAKEYLERDSLTQDSRENYSYTLDADSVRAHINSLVCDNDAGIIFIDDEDKYALNYFTNLDEETQKKIASLALHQTVEIEDSELLNLGDNITNDAANYVIDYIENHDI